jgi:hypothetical protein
MALRIVVHMSRVSDVISFIMLCHDKNHQLFRCKYYPFIKLPHCQCQNVEFFLECTYGDIPFQLPVHKI